jgi:hypothetical protein
MQVLLQKGFRIGRVQTLELTLFDKSLEGSSEWDDSRDEEIGLRDSIDADLVGEDGVSAYEVGFE